MAYEKTQCPKCGQGFRFAPEHLGSKTRCKQCQAIFVIARPAAAAKPTQQTQPAQPVKAKPVKAQAAQAPPAAKPVQAKPVQAASVKAAPTPVAPAAPVQAAPVPAKAVPQAAKPVAAKPAAKPAAKSKQPVAAKTEPDSPYEAFVDEVMTGVGSTVQKVAALPQGTAAEYLKANKQLNLGRAKRDSDWATTFIFRGTNLAMFGFLLFGISMFGLSVGGFGSMLMPLTSPLCALIALSTGIIGSIMVMVGFATKPGSAAVCGLVPILLFVAGGFWLGSRYIGGHWDIDSKSMARVADHHRENEDDPDFQARFNPPDFARPNENARLKEARNAQQEAMRRAEQEMDAFQRRIEKKFNDPFKQPKPKIVQREPRPNPVDLRPQEPPVEVKVEPVKPAPAPDTPDPFANWNKSQPDNANSDSSAKSSTKEDAGTKSIPFANFREDFGDAIRTRIELERNARERFGVRSNTNFPQANLIGTLGEPKLPRPFGAAMIASPARPLIGFHALESNTGGECRQLTPIYDRGTKASSLAREGYVLAGLEAGFRNGKLVVVRGIFMKQDGKKLNTSDRYLGGWVGDSSETGNTSKIESDGAIPIGIRIVGVSNVESVALIID